MSDQKYGVIAPGTDPGGGEATAKAAGIALTGQAFAARPSSANTLHYFVNTMFNYPTMAEAYRVAALNGPNRLA